MANMWQMIDVKTACSDFLILQLQPTNCLGIGRISAAHGCSKLLELTNAFAVDHFIEVSKCNELLTLSSDEVCKYANIQSKKNTMKK